MTFKAGIPGWVWAGNPLNKENALPKTDIPKLRAAQVNQIQKDVVIVDVRVKKLHKTGYIKDSIKIPTGLISRRYNEIPSGKKIVLVDHAGKQVLIVGRFLKSKGYQDVKRLQGGIMGWKKLGLPLEK